METIVLKATARDPKSKPNVIRKNGNVPCVVYGHNVSKLTVQCPIFDLHRALEKAGESSLLELDVDGKKIPVLFKNVDFHPVSDREIHVDFYAVNMSEEIEAQVPLHVEGESPAVKTLSGVLVTVRDHVRVRCLPAKLPRFIVVSIASLENFHDSILVSQLAAPEGVKIMDDAATMLITVQEPRKEEEITPVAAVPAEGAAPADGTAPAAAPGAPAPEAQAKEKAAKEGGKK
jgi:large subunit ribosomal protein L25